MFLKIAETPEKFQKIPTKLRFMDSFFSKVERVEIHTCCHAYRKFGVTGDKNLICLR